MWKQSNGTMSNERAYVCLQGLYERILASMEIGKGLVLLSTDAEAIKTAQGALAEDIREMGEQCSNCRYGESREGNPYWDGFYKCHHDYGYHFPYNRCDMWSAKGGEYDED